MTPQQRTITSTFRKLSKLKVFVIGDAMLDSYLIGNITRISPEAPVPVVQITERREQPGGAANVALNCRALDANVTLFTVLGNDESGKTLCKMLSQEGISTEGCLLSKKRKTTTKTRVLSKSQQVLRLDDEQTDSLDTKDEHAFIDLCLRAIQIDVPDVIIFEDYNKGVLLPNVIRKITEHAKRFHTIIAVDPKKDHFFEYENVDIFKPNLKEIREALNDEQILPNKSSLTQIHHQLKVKLQHHITLITLSEHGIFVAEKKKSFIFPSRVRNIADVSGAGDTVIAVFAMMYAVVKDIAWCTEVANLAGGLVCEELGVKPVNRQKLMKELQVL